MSSLFVIYWPVILASAILAGGLAVLGTHVAMRDQSMQTLCLSQAALLGVLIGIGAGDGRATSIEQVLPFISAALVSAICFWVSERWIRRLLASRSTILSALLVVLMSLAALTTSLFPGLENHMSQQFFGDLATTSSGEVWFLGVIALALATTLFIEFRRMLRRSFDQAAFGADAAHKNRDWLFPLILLTAVSASVQLVGFLFVATCLFVPTSVLTSIRVPGLRLHLVLCVGTAVVGTVIGFTGSLMFTVLPTVPTIVVAMVVCAIVGRMAILAPRR
jgi:zinc transport system permease protein